MDDGRISLDLIQQAEYILAAVAQIVLYGHIYIIVPDSILFLSLPYILHAHLDNLTMELFSAKLSLFVFLFFLFLLLLFLAEGNRVGVAGRLVCCLPISTMLCLRSCEFEITVRRIANSPWPLVSMEVGALDEAP